MGLYSFFLSTPPQLGLATGADGLFVTDYSLCRVAKFDFSGTLVWSFGQVGTGNGQVSHPGRAR